METFDADSILTAGKHILHYTVIFEPLASQSILQRVSSQHDAATTRLHCEMVFGLHRVCMMVKPPQLDKGLVRKLANHMLGSPNTCQPKITCHTLITPMM